MSEALLMALMCRRRCHHRRRDRLKQRARNDRSEGHNGSRRRDGANAEVDMLWRRARWRVEVGQRGTSGRPKRKVVRADESKGNERCT